MLPVRARIAALTLTILLFSGCTSANTTDPAAPGGVDPDAPVAAGHPALPSPEEPTPLEDRTLSGLYASPPSADTLAALATAAPSPDGLFRAVLSGDQIWVTRIDGAWLWQVTLPPVGAGAGTAQSDGQGTTPGGAQGPDASGSTDGAGNASGSAGGVATNAPAGPHSPTSLDGQAGSPDASAPAGGAAPTPVGPLQWSPPSTLLFRDSVGRWLEADPLAARVTPLNGALNGATMLIPSPDGRQVLYYKGNKLYTALRDGSQPQLVGENVIGHWDSTGQLVVKPQSGGQAPE